jgi:hypothetical protein
MAGRDAMTAASAPSPRTTRPPLRIEPVVEAARAALQLPGPARWTLDVRTDRVELRPVVRRWSTAAEPPARLARVACGAALRAARLAVAVQGRQPLVSHPDQPGVLAVLHAGEVVPPRREELLLHATLLLEPGPARNPAQGLTAVLRWLRRAAESEGAWLRLLPEPPAPSTALGPCWDRPDGPRRAPTAPAPVTVVIGAPGRLPAADLRAGQAVETVRLTAAALGLDLHVLAAPAAATAAIERCTGRTTDTLAVVQIGNPGYGPTTS